MASTRDRKRKAGKTLAYSRRPSERTRWSYFMNGMQPDSDDLSAVTEACEAFGGAHPAWFIASRPGREVTGAHFRQQREFALGLSRRQVAVYLRVSPRTVADWENDATKVPFAAFEALRLLGQTDEFRLSHSRWDGWFINSVSGELVSPDRGRLAVTPEEINGLPQLYAQRDRHAARADRLQSQLEAAIAENTRLRELFLSDGVTDQLRQMQDNLAGLLGRIGTAQVLDFPLQASTPPQAKVATK